MLMLKSIVVAMCIANASGFATLPRSPQCSRHQRTLCAKRIKTDSGLQYEEVLVGDGPLPGNKDYVSVHYDAKFARSGKYFDSSKPEEVGLEETRRLAFQGKPIQVPLGRKAVIVGFDEGIASMNVGGKRRLYIPSSLGYGSTGYRDIPANADLIFDVELVSVDNPMSGQFGSVGNLGFGFQVAFGLIVLNGLTEAITGTELREYIVNAIN